MDIQKIDTIDYTAAGHKQKIEKVQESNKIRHMDEHDQESQNAKKDKQMEAQEDKRIKLNTLSYGYNEATGDLVVKIVKADGSVGQYPTDSMMKLKALLKNEFVEKNDT